MRETQALLRDILDAIEKVEKYAARGREVFEREELVQVGIGHHVD